MTASIHGQVCHCHIIQVLLEIRPVSSLVAYRWSSSLSVSMAKVFFSSSTPHMSSIHYTFMSELVNSRYLDAFRPSLCLKILFLDSRPAKTKQTFVSPNLESKFSFLRSLPKKAIVWNQSFPSSRYNWSIAPFSLLSSASHQNGTSPLY